MNSEKKRRYANKPSLRREISFQAYISKTENGYIEQAMGLLSRRIGRKMSKGEFLMWMFSELFGDKEHTLSELNDFENDSAKIRDAITILNDLLEKREGFINRLRDYSEDEDDNNE